MGMANCSDKIIDQVLSEIPCDDNWDTSDPLQLGYSKAKLKRYDLSYIKSAESIEDKKTSKEEFYSSADTSKGSKQISIETGTAEEGDPDAASSVKVEFPLHEEVKKKLAEITSAKGHMLCIISHDNASNLVYVQV